LSNNLSVRKFSSKHAKFEAKNLYFEKKFRSKIKMLSMHNLHDAAVSNVRQNMAEIFAHFA